VVKNETFKFLLERELATYHAEQDIEVLSPWKIHEEDETNLQSIPVSGYALIVTEISSAQTCVYRPTDSAKRRMSKAERKKAKNGDCFLVTPSELGQPSPPPEFSSSLSIVVRKSSDDQPMVAYEVLAPHNLLASYYESLRFT
jgi:hypothetical protein